MGASNENAADEDSRTATFDKKRPLDVAVGEESLGAGSTKSTPRKRAKHAATMGHQDVRDFVPKGATFSTNAISVGGDLETGDEKTSDNLGREISVESPMAVHHAKYDQLSRRNGKIATNGAVNAENGAQQKESANTGGADNSLEDVDNDGAAIASVNEGRRLHVGNLAYSANENHLKQLFNQFSMY